MSTTTPEAEHAGPPQGPPPWINPTMQQRVGWRDGDIVISVPPKSGTTWTMNIVHQLRSGGDTSFFDIHEEVPWLELVPNPDSDLDAIVERFDAMPNDRRRAFKSHGAPPELPFQRAGAGPDVRYIAVVRNPDEAVASFRPFIASHSDEFYAMWGADPAPLVGPDFATYAAGFGTHVLAPRVFGFVASWWPLRNEPNVLLVHYADLKREPEKNIRTIAEFLGFDVPADKWPAILEYTSFAWMKAHEEKFELRSVSDVPMLDPGAMLRKGQVGASEEDGITPEISNAIAEVGHTIITDPDAYRWCYEGGAI